jgi:iron complex outermembrane receptor protein
MARPVPPSGRLAAACSILLGFTVLTALPALAADPPPPSAPEEERASEPAGSFHQEVVVTTSPPLAEETRVGAAELAERPAADLAQALRDEPGLDAVRRGPINLDPQVRGAGESQLLVLVDGGRTFAAGPGRMDSEMSHVDPQMVESVRVVKGPYALSWGPGALAAIAVDTFTPPFGAAGRGLSGHARAGWAGNGDLVHGGAAAWWSDERWRTVLQHDHREGGDYESGGGLEVPGDFTSRTTRWGLGRALAPGLELDYRGTYQAQDDIDYPGRNLDAELFRLRTHQLALAWGGGDAGGLDEARLEFYSSAKDHRMNNDGKPNALPMPGRVPPFGVDVDLPTSSDALGTRGSARWSAGGFELSAGTDAFHLEQDATRTIARRDTGAVMFVDRVWSDVRFDHLGGFLEATLPAERWSLTGTVRLDAEGSEAGDVSEFFRAHTTGALERDDTEPSAALVWTGTAGRRWSLTAGAGQVVRFPTALERYADRTPSSRFQVAAEFLGSPDLAPERATQLDLGAAWAGDRVSLRLDLWARTIDDHVTVAADPSLPRRLPGSPPVVYRWINGGGADFRGGELDVYGRAGTAWRWRLMASWMRGEDDTFGEPAFGTPPDSARASLRWQPAARGWLELAAEAVAEQDRVATARLERPTPSYETFDLRGGLGLGGGLRLLGGVDNLGDEDYARHLSSLNPFTGERIPEPGRRAWAAIELEW